MANPWEHHRFGRNIFRQKESGPSWWQIPITYVKQPWVMFSVSSSGTFVNREETSKEHIIPLLCLYFLAQCAKLKESLYWLVEIG